MSRPSPTHACRWLVPAILLLAASTLQAERWSTEEPQWLRLQIPETSVGVNMQGLNETVSDNGSTSTHDNYFIVPMAGLHTMGSIYHPNLMSFDFNGQGGLGWAEDKVTSSSYSQTRHESQSLFNYLATANFLSAKPYNGSFYAAQDHTYNNYDFFNTTTVDSFRYGGHAGWATESFNLNSDAGYQDQTASGLTGVSETTETFLHANGISQRDTGNSTLSYSYEDFGSQLNYGPIQSSVSQSISGSDTETLGAQKQVTATTGAGYSWAEYPSQNAETFNATENVTARLRPNLQSFAALTYDDSRLDPSSANVFQGVAGIHHQLYESLASTYDVHGNYNEVDNPGSSATNDRYGVGAQENYTKRLGPWGRLSLGGSGIFDHEDHEFSGNSIVTVINEPHVLSNTTQTYLANPNVIQSTIFVTGPGGVPVYAKGVDYQVIIVGELTQIQRVPTSVILPNGAAVLVSYQSQSLFNSSYNSVIGSLNLRLDLFNLLGVYGRLNAVDNDAPPQAVTETLTDWVGGADVTWRWLRAGAEYEDYDSTFTQYKATRLFQSLTFQPAEATTAGFNFNQIFYRYPDGREQTLYQFLGQFNTQLRPWLTWTAEGGYFYQDALGVTQDLGAVRTGLNFAWGKLTIKFGYQYNYQLTQDIETRESNFLYLQLTRVF